MTGWPLLNEMTTEMGFYSTEDIEVSTFASRTIPPVNETQTMKAQLAAYDILIPLLGTLIIISNAAVVVSSGLLLKKGQQPRCTYLLLGNVAMADLVTGIAVIIGQAYPKSHRTHNMCSFQIGMIVSSTLASIYSVGLIATDRFLYILYGLKYHHWVYPTRARCLIAATWFLGLVIGYLPLMGWAGDTDNGRVCWFIMLAPPGLVVLTTIVGIIPVLLVVVLYSIILYNAIKKVIQLRKISSHPGAEDTSGNPNQMRMFRGGAASTTKQPIKTVSGITPEVRTKETNDEDIIEEESIAPVPELSQSRKVFNQLKRIGKQPGEIDTTVQVDKKPSNPTKWKAIKVVLFTTGSFVCTWLPYFVACTIYVFCDFKETQGRCQRLKFAIASPLAILGFINSLLNPVIYAWWHNGFRKSMKKMCCQRKKVGVTSADSKNNRSSAQVSRTTSSSNTFTSIFRGTK